MSTAIVVNGLEAYGHFAVSTHFDDYLLAVGFFGRSKTKVRGIAASLGKREVKWRYSRYKSRTSESTKEWHGVFTPVLMGRDQFTYCVAVNEDVGKNFLLTTEHDLDSDFYNYLMNHYKLPLLREWMPALREFLLREHSITKEVISILKGGDSKEVIELRLDGKSVSLNDIICYNFGRMSEDLFEEKVSYALQKGIIWITKDYMEPMEFETFDDYIIKYGSSLVDNLNKEISPLTGLNPNVSTLALKTKSLFPQQAASVNGILAMMDHGIKNAVLNMGMGTGKTIQAASAMEAAMVKKWLRKHPGKTLRDAYEPGVINYRAIIMAPGHLVSKWASEIEEEIPYANCTILHGGLAQLVELREKGKEPTGKEFYILSKDFAKLDTWVSPIPSQVKMKPMSLAICKDCAEEEGKIYFKKGYGPDARCPSCNGTNFKSYAIKRGINRRGLVCPGCGELLIKNKGYDPASTDFYEDLDSYVLTPKSFASHKGENSTCYHCGISLWGSNAKPVVAEGNTPAPPKWYKVSHFSNHAKKSKTTAFVLRGHEEDYYASVITTAGLVESSQIYGPRKYAPAKFVKHYLKGFFDFCILDEAHKYLGDSAQGVAAHAIVKASRFTLALTGTISNGTAESFFNLFWMLEPDRMKEMGYSYSRGELMRFCKQYGCIETLYEAGDSNDRKNFMSRGRQLSPPRVKPGISPVIFGKLLMDRCLFLDISDLSKYLPKFTETVKLVEAPYELQAAYERTVDILNDESQKGAGMGVLSTMLQFGLSYLDKPYGREPIMDPYVEDAVLVNPPNYEQYENLNVLTPKEEELLKIINQEVSEGRNCFIYATFTGKPEANVTWRLKALVEARCNLSGRVEIIQSESPAASKREEWFHKRAADGIKVFITNPANVETGLDFCFKHEGKTYNYPTLIFYQTGYQLATVWQASRRAYRLNQREECRNFYLAYENTLQAAALEIMAKKQSATSAIQGKFSTEGLSAMAKGVDTRTQLAAALAKNDMSSRESLENMFDALNQNVEADDSYGDFTPSPSYYELMGVSEEKKDDIMSVFEDSFNFGGAFAEDFMFDDTVVQPVDSTETTVVVEEVTLVEEVVANVVTEIPPTTEELFNSFFGFEGFSLFEQEPVVAPVVKKKTKKNEPAGQVNLFDFLAV